MKTNRLYLYILFIFLLLPTWSSYGCWDRDVQAEPEKSETSQDETRQPAVEVMIMQISAQKITDRLVLPAATEPVLDVLLASELAGQIENIMFVEGQEVQKGKVLLKQDVSLLKAEMERAEAAFALASAMADRRKNLSSKRIISDEALETSLNELTLAKVNLHQAEIRYAQGFIRSPIQGVLNELFVDSGEYVQPGQKVAEVLNVDQIRLVANVPEMDVAFLNIGAIVQVSIDALPEEHWTGKIEFISYKADNATRTFKVKILVDNKEHRIRPGMIGRVRFIKRNIQNAVAVPLTAILDKNGERIVFVEEDGIARSRRIKIGVIERDRAQILSGLNIGENLIISGHDNLEDGLKVKVL